MRNPFGNNDQQPTAFQLQRLVLCLLLVVAGLFSFFPASAAELPLQAPSENYSDQTDILYAGIYSDLSCNPLGSSSPAELPIEEARESEFSEEEDNSPSDELFSAGFDLQALLLSQTQLGQGAHFSQHRTTVPFYILFHAWKSYLS